MYRQRTRTRHVEELAGPDGKRAEALYALLCVNLRRHFARDFTYDDRVEAFGLPYGVVAGPDGAEYHVVRAKEIHRVTPLPHLFVFAADGRFVEMVPNAAVFNVSGPVTPTGRVDDDAARHAAAALVVEAVSMRGEFRLRLIADDPSSALHATTPFVIELADNVLHVELRDGLPVLRVTDTDTAPNAATAIYAFDLERRCLVVRSMSEATR